jgi:hypothetical protein
MGIKFAGHPNLKRILLCGKDTRGILEERFSCCNQKKKLGG